MQPVGGTSHAPASTCFDPPSLARGKNPGFDLMIISDGGEQLIARLERALVGVPPGRVAIQLRERGYDDDALLALARTLRALTQAHGALLLINDRIDLAQAIAADGVHLPERGVGPREARSQLAPGTLVGVSRHDAAGLARAAAEGADYATLSPVHAVAGKAPALTIAGFSAICRAAPLPVYALGGVRVPDVAPLCAGGARGVAVMREILSAADPSARTQQLIAAIARSMIDHAG